MSKFGWTNLLGISDTRKIPFSWLLLIANGTCELTWNNIGFVKKGKENEMVPDVLGKSKGITVASLVWTRVTQKMCSPTPLAGKYGEQTGENAIYYCSKQVHVMRYS